METLDLVDFVINEGWRKRWVEDEMRDSRYEDFEYERSYADFTYDEMTIWKDEKRISVSYNDIGWGYSNIECYDFTYEEFIDWWEGMK